MNSYYYQDTPAQRRHSAWDVSLAPKWRNRSHSAGLINLAGFSPGLSQMNTNTQRAPATPCFMSPRMAFSTQFSYDSPIQILTSGKGPSNVLDPRSVSQLRGRCSFRRLSRRCKIVLILLFAALGTGLFINRKMHEFSNTSQTESCNDEEDCELPHIHPGLTKRFLDIVSLDKIQQHFHAITKDLRVGSAEEEAGQSEQPEAVKQPEEPSKMEAQENPMAPDEAEAEESEGLHILEESAYRYPRSTDGMSPDEEDEEGEEEEEPSDPQTDSPPPHERRGQAAPGTRRTTVVARHEKGSARSQHQYQASGHHQRRGQSRGHKGRPQDGRKYGQPGRPVKIPPGVNPRRYGL